MGDPHSFFAPSGTCGITGCRLLSAEAVREKPGLRTAVEVFFLVSQACRGIFRKAASKTAPFFRNDVLMPLDTAFTVRSPVAGVLHRFA
jgi:hypothetical protein